MENVHIIIVFIFAIINLFVIVEYLIIYIEL